MEIMAIATSDFQKNGFVVILKEKDGQRRLPIVIGTFEAQAIVIAIKQLGSNRPLTHDLFRNVLLELNTHLIEVIVSELKDGVFHATLVLEKTDGTIFEMDSRTSDAIALAVRFKAPVFVKSDILDQAGVVFDDDNAKQVKEVAIEGKEIPLVEKTTVELEVMLQEALQDEAYEYAARIRDVLKKRGSN